MEQVGYISASTPSGRPERRPEAEAVVVSPPVVDPVGGPPAEGAVTRTRRLHQVFESACDRDPSAIALECGNERLTYRELDGRANRLAHHLRALGVAGDARVAILLQRSVETYVALLGVGKAGA
ncbi:AMP-binding protein, partial [Micromonospora sp. LZ34]